MTPLPIGTYLAHHIEYFAGPGVDGHPFTGPRSGRLRRSNGRDGRTRAEPGAGDDGAREGHGRTSVRERRRPRSEGFTL
ncbi:hypothetical protein GCM10009663_50300 [Kitasatospora arboriphila]|uniref:Uncharacterized protein n=1 Tax=Kitasatospora arboriphila TaxID=258052 RepID=A0ABN1TSZ2_9ACTN